MTDKSAKPNLEEVVIAWIEDDSDVIFGVVKPLLKLGMRIKPYYTYAEALAAVEDIRDCDLILLDVILPPGASGEGGNNLGIKLLRLLRDKFKLSAPIIVFSIVANAHDLISAEELERLQAHALPKGITPLELKTEVLELLGRSSH